MPTIAPPRPAVESRLADALASVDFDWIDRASTIWEDDDRDVPEIHRDTLRALDRRLEQAERARDRGMLGSVVLGPAGAGKTHLLGALRRRVWARDGYFILIDLTGVREFATTAALGFLRALEHRLPDGMLQHEKLLERLANRFVGPACGDIVRDIRISRDPESIRVLLGGLERGLGQEHRGELIEHADVLRALVRFSVGSFEDANIAYAWLQGAEIAEAVSQLGLRQSRRAPEQVVAGLLWLMSLTGPCAVGIDQLDAIIGAYHAMAQGNADDDDARRARTVIDGVAVGLMELVRGTRRALVTVCCLEPHWDHMQRNALASVVHSFEPAPLYLAGVAAADAARALVERRLAPAFAQAGVPLPYPSWPFRPEAFENVGNVTPRWLLMQCDAHVRRCLDAGDVVELARFAATPAPQPPAPPSPTLDAAFEAARRSADVAALGFSTDADETPMRRLLAAMGRLLALQNGGQADIDIRVESAFDPRRPALHLRVAHIHRGEGDREEVFAFRFLPQLNAIAFQARLTAAVTQAGIDRQMSFRHLLLLRAGDAPTGRRTAELMDQFRAKGGRLVAPSQDDLRTLVALAQMEASKPEGFVGWLAARRPLDGLSMAAAAGEAWPRIASGAPPAPPTSPAPEPKGGKGSSATEEGTGKQAPQSGGGSPTAPSPEPPTPRPPEPAPPPPEPPLSPPPGGPLRDDGILLGTISGLTPKDFRLPLATLRKHVAIVAGSGSGKSVLLRRMVEEAVRRGVPAIVIDTNNDLALLGEPWPAGEAPADPAHGAAAADYFARAEVVVWTPGVSTGNPISLAPLPDFAALRGDPDELEGAVELAATTLEAHVAPGNGQTDQLRQGLLRSAMRAFAEHGTGGLEDFIAFLADLPPEAAAGITRAERLAAAMADSLRAAIARNPLMASAGTPLNPQRLITAATPGRVRVSVINLSGLASAPAQQGFVNRLALALFTFVRRNPPAAGVPLTALLAIDEAHQFAPAGKATPSRESLISLAKQARKYGLGLLFATQMPKDLHHGIVNNCATHVFGKASSETAVDTIREMMQSRGRAAGDVARLATGTFYVCMDADRPEKVVTPLCLSHHPASPADSRRIIALAQRLRG